jgi:hypothetical protein
LSWQGLFASPAGKGESIDRLFRSFGVQADDAVDAAWAKEAESRIDASEPGRVTADSTQTVLARSNRK